jgi:hypothetical protein
MNKKSNILFFVLCFLVTTNIMSQEVVVSEYFNAGSPGNEFTELLIINDNISLENYTLRDFRYTSGFPEEQFQAIVFKSDFWTGLREGTVIIINHRGAEEVDVNKSDGYIEIGAENENYFYKIDAGDDWDSYALSIDSEGDIIEILDNIGNHVHSLSHMPEAGGYYESINNPKLNYPGVCPERESISVAPGSDISNYDGGNTEEWCILSGNGNSVTEGKPNKRLNYEDANLEYWQALREPEWGDNSLNIEIRPDNIDFFWNAAEDNNASDMIQGYLLVRIETDSLAEAEHPKNGTSYKRDDRLGSAVVIENVTNSWTISYSYKEKIECNQSYIFRVYAYRYDADDIDGNGISPSNGRGRTYNTKRFAEGTVRKTGPAKPVIEIPGGDNRFCSGDSLLLTAKVYGGPYSYRWFVNSQYIPGSNSRMFYAKSAGWYTVEITNEKGCSSVSDSVEIIELPSPDSRIYLFTDTSVQAGKRVYGDTTVVCCENESFILKVEGGDRYEWFRNYVKLANTSSTLLADSGGQYFAVAINDGMECADTTSRIFIDMLHVDCSFDRDTLYYYLDKFTKYGDEVVKVGNLSTDSLIFSYIEIPPGGVFSLFTPPPSEVVPPMNIKDYTVRFEPNRSGIFVDSITFILPCQDSIKRIYLFAEKERMNVVAEPDTVVFDTLLSCIAEKSEFKIKVINYENFSIEIRDPVIEPPFEIQSPDFPQELEGNSEIEITLQVGSLLAGTHNGELNIPFYSNGVRDELTVELFVTVLEASYRIEYYGEPATEIEFPELTGCEDSSSISLQIFNTGDVPLEFSQFGNIAEINIPDFPLIIDSKSSKEIKVIFVPLLEGEFSDKLYITTNPCDYLDSVSLKGSKKGITYGLSKSSIEFGNIIQCRNPEAVSDTFRILVSGKSNENPYIEKVTGPSYNYFTHNITAGKQLGDINEFVVSFESMPLGEYYDTVSLMIQPCDVEKIIPIHGRRIEPILIFSTDTVDFGDVEIEKSGTNSLIIINDGEISVSISNIAVLSQPFELLSVLPVTLDSGDSVEILFGYNPKLLQEDKLKLDVLMSEPCDLTYDLWLMGRGSEAKEMDVSLEFPEYLLSEPGKEVTIPVNIKSLDSRSLASADISGFNIELRYNPTLLYPLSVSPGDAIATAQPTDLQFEETEQGLTTVRSQIGDHESFKDGRLFDLRFMTLLGNEISTQLVFDSIDFNSKTELIPDTSSGFLRLIGECALDERLLRLDGNFDLYLASENPVRDNGTLVFEIPSEEMTELTLVDIMGNCVKVLAKGCLIPGRYTVDFSISDINSGIYIVYLKNGTKVKKFKLGIVK